MEMRPRLRKLRRGPLRVPCKTKSTSTSIKVEVSNVRRTKEDPNPHFHPKGDSPAFGDRDSQNPNPTFLPPGGEPVAFRRSNPHGPTNETRSS